MVNLNPSRHKDDLIFILGIAQAIAFLLCGVWVMYLNKSVSSTSRSLSNYTGNTKTNCDQYTYYVAILFSIIGIGLGIANCVIVAEMKDKPDEARA